MDNIKKPLLGTRIRKHGKNSRRYLYAGWVDDIDPETHRYNEFYQKRRIYGDEVELADKEKILKLTSIKNPLHLVKEILK